MNYSNYFLTGALVFAGLVNFAPVLGVLSAERLTAFYGVDLDSPDLVVLMRHRAVLFGLTGGLILAGAMVPGLRIAGVAVALISMLAFMGLVALTDSAGPALRKLAWIDSVPTVVLIFATLIHYWPRPTL